MAFGIKMKPTDTPRPELSLPELREGITAVFKNGEKVFFIDYGWINMDEILHLSFDTSKFKVIYPRENIAAIKRYK